jgi:hypothetical protein
LRKSGKRRRRENKRLERGLKEWQARHDAHPEPNLPRHSEEYSFAGYCAAVSAGRTIPLEQLTASPIAGEFDHRPGDGAINGFDHRPGTAPPTDSTTGQGTAPSTDSTTGQGTAPSTDSTTGQGTAPPTDSIKDDDRVLFVRDDNPPAPPLNFTETLRQRQSRDLDSSDDDGGQKRVEAVQKFINDIGDDISTRVSPELKSKFLALLEEFQDVFYDSSGALPSIPGVQHDIELVDGAKPVRIPLRRIHPNNESYNTRRSSNSSRKLSSNLA